MSYDESALKTIQENLTKVSKDLSEHVREDKRIHEKSQVYLPEYQEASTMGMDNISDKVNINVCIYVFGSFLKTHIIAYENYQRVHCCNRHCP